MHRIVIAFAACCSLTLAGCSQSTIATPPTQARSPRHAAPDTLSKYRILYSFDGTEGSHPTGTLANYRNIMYGTTTDGGDNGLGTVFHVQPDGKNSFRTDSFSADKGCNPIGGGIFANRSNAFLGTATSCGNASKAGTLYGADISFKRISLKHTFDLATDGGNPYGVLCQIGDTFYGTARNGGANGKGTFYSLKGDAFTVLHAFGAGDDGANPMAGCTELGGKLYGTTYAGGSEKVGAIYEFDPATGKEKVLHSFDTADGARPQTTLLAWNGMLYGVTSRGGTNSAGVLFKTDPATGDTRVLYNFGSGDALRPDGTLIVNKDALYGTTMLGGSTGKDDGTIFRYTPATKKYEELYAFSGKPDGAHPRGGLNFSFVDRQDQFFGTTYDGGSEDKGTAYSFVL
jgi:uncharacterized repeat protein (TIGR03803 family)